MQTLYFQKDEEQYKIVAEDAVIDRIARQAQDAGAVQIREENFDAKDLIKIPIISDQLDDKIGDLYCKKGMVIDNSTVVY